MGRFELEINTVLPTNGREFCNEQLSYHKSNYMSDEWLINKTVSNT